jgi:hypothetical protein
MIKRSSLLLPLFCIFEFGCASLLGSPTIYIDDSSGRLGVVDVQSGATTVIGSTGLNLTDIAFAPNGELYGLTFTGFYRINPQTAACTFVGSHGIPNGNALVFDSDGKLYAAGSQSTSFYQINPATGVATALGNIGYFSAGDLAFKNGNLYLSSTTNELIRISLSSYSGTSLGPLGFSSVFGLATGSNNVLYGISGTQIFSVNTSNGAGTFLVDYQGKGLGPANGSSFISEAVPSQLLNISTRVRVQSGENVLIGGSIITGSVPKKVIVRAIGPSLSAAGVAGALADPVLELHTANGAVLTNDDWKSDQRAEIEATGIPPRSDRESAIVVTLSPGNCTAVVSGFGGAAGVALIEVYDLDATAASKLGNISTRASVSTGENVMIGGFIVGNGSATQRILARGIGPSLSNFGVQNPLQDPTLDLYNGNGALIGSNDNWRDSQQAAIQATGIAPQNDKESAIIGALPPGNYTAILRGKNNTTGVGLVEVYNVN